MKCTLHNDLVANGVNCLVELNLNEFLAACLGAVKL
jgi:hypothetical protein